MEFLCQGNTEDLQSFRVWTLRCSSWPIQHHGDVVHLSQRPLFCSRPFTEQQCLSSAATSLPVLPLETSRSWWSIFHQLHVASSSILFALQRCSDPTGVGTCPGSGSVGVISSGLTSQVEVTSRVPRQVTTTLLLPLVVSAGGGGAAAGLCMALTRSSRQSNLLPSPHSQTKQTATTSRSHCHGHRWRPAVL